MNISLFIPVKAINISLNVTGQVIDIPPWRKVNLKMSFFNSLMEKRMVHLQLGNCNQTNPLPRHVVFAESLT